MAEHYSYCVAALITFAVYMLFDFDKIVSSKKACVLLIFILIFLTASHAFNTRWSSATIKKQTSPLKKYFDAVNNFAATHKKEPDFSFKIIDRPPRVDAFSWYHETCIDGLFDHFINNGTPKYLLEYDYVSEKLTYSPYNKTKQIMTASGTSSNISEKADYVNSLGMRFKKIPGDKDDIFLGIFEVTQKQWEKVMEFNPSRFQQDMHPVENVSYNMVRQFVSRLNKMESDGLYRLPTIEDYLKILDSTVSEDNINSCAWFAVNAQGTTHAVGSLAPTCGGFYDLFGNVWEWTDNPIYYDQPVKPFKDSPHMCFGGSWRDRDFDFENPTANYPVDFKNEHLGFRLVKELMMPYKEIAK